MAGKSEIESPRASPATTLPVLDFRALFEHLPGPCTVVLPDAPRFTIVGVNDAYLRATGSSREGMLSRGIADVFPEILGGRDFRESLERALATRTAHRMPTQKMFQERYWRPTHTPVPRADGTVQYILQCLEDGTDEARAAEKERADQRDAFLVRLDDATRSLADPSEITEAASRMLGEHLQVDRCAYCTVEADQDRFEIRWDYCRPGVPSIVGRYSLAQFGEAAGELLRANLPYVVDDMESDSRTAGHDTAFRQTEIRAHASVPLLKAGRLVALLGFHQTAPRHWAPEEIELMRIVVSRCWESLERARVGRELQKSEHRLRLAQRAAHSGTFEWLIHEDHVVWTPELEALFGLPEGAFEGSWEDWRNRVVAEDAERVAAGIQECMVTRQAECVFEFRALLPDGAQRWLRGHAQFFYEPAGAVRMIGTIVDIDLQKQAEIELRKQWQTFDTALSNTPDFTYIFDLDGRFTYLNRKLLSVLRVELEQALGKNFLELGYPPELAARLQRQIQQVIDTRQPLRDETPFTDADAETREYEYIFVPVFTRDGRVEAVAGSTRDITERSKAEAMVEEDRGRWRELLLQAPAAIALLSGAEHRFDWVNDACLRLAGKPASALLGLTVRKSMPELADQIYLDRLDHVYRTGEPFFGHESLVRLSRGDRGVQSVYVNFAFLATRNRAGEIEGVFIHAMDVTETVASRKTIEDSEKRFRWLVDSAKDHAIIGLDLEGFVTHWNTGAERLLGFREPEILGQPGSLIFTPEDRAARVPEMELSAARERGQGSDERWHMRKDGTRFWGSGTVTPLIDDAGTMEGFVKVFQDRTREWITREALRESEERFRQLANSMPQMVWAARPDGYLDYFNERWYEFTGLDRSLGGDHSWDLQLHPDDQTRCREAWYSSVRSGEPYQLEYRLWDRHESRWRWFMGRALPIRDGAGQIIRWFGTCTDIDEQKTTQQAVLQAHKLESIGLLASGIAHDFNNLLVGIMGGASFALDTIPSSHPAYPLLQGAVDASERAADLTRQMLAYAGKGRFVIEPVNLSTVVVQTANLIAASIPKSVHIELRLEENLPTVYTDAGQMQQVAMNLIINAAEAIGEGSVGQVIVRTRSENIGPLERCRDVPGNLIPPGCYAVLEVQDTGCGLDPAMLAKIFDPFFTTKFTGRGLGLAAVLGIVRSHQGAIQVETTPNEGSTFRVLLPGRHAETTAKTPVPAAAEAIKGSETVLVIDDEDAVRRIAKVGLEKSGFTVAVARTGEEGLQHVRGNPAIQLVLLDMSMPHMTGRRVLEAIRALRPKLPVIICSGYTEDEIYFQFSGLDMAGVLQKPFTVSRLAAKVRDVLDRPRRGE